MFFIVYICVSDVSLPGAAHGERGDLRLAQGDVGSAGQAAAALRERRGGSCDGHGFYGCFMVVLW